MLRLCPHLNTSAKALCRSANLEYFHPNTQIQFTLTPVTLFCLSEPNLGVSLIQCLTASLITSRLHSELLDCAMLCVVSDAGPPHCGVSGGAWQECKNQMTSNGNCRAVGGRRTISFALINTLTPLHSPALSLFDFPPQLGSVSLPAVAQHHPNHAPKIGPPPRLGPVV